jgi:hypothetical protein
VPPPAAWAVTVKEPAVPAVMGEGKPVTVSVSTRPKTRTPDGVMRKRYLPSLLTVITPLPNDPTLPMFSPMFSWNLMAQELVS